MSEIENRIQAFAKAKVTPRLSIPPAFDDLPLTVDAFRLLAHLFSRADVENHSTQASYVQIGEACYRATWPNSTKSALRKRAMAAMKELVAFNLVRVETTTGPNGGQGINRYVLIFLN